MSSQVDFALKSTSTKVTAERFVATVLTTVGDQIGTLRERLAANVAFVGFFTFDGRKRRRRRRRRRRRGKTRRTR